MLYKDGKFAIADNIGKSRFGKLDLQSIERPSFTIEDMQSILDDFAIMSKCEVVYGTSDVKEQPKQKNKLSIQKEASDDDSR